jgi:hypothetical protein
MIATVWYPPDHWQTNEIVQTSTLPWDIGPTFSVGLGIVQGDDWSEVRARLPIRVESSEQIVRLFDGDTWVRLLHIEDGRAVQERRILNLPTPQYPLDTDFAGQIRLLGYDLHTQYPLSNIQLYWQAQARMRTSYTVFAQLIGPAGNVRTQVDSVPQGGGYPTTWWLPGEVVVDPLILELPPDAPRNVPYRLIIGLYDAATGTRLLVAGSSADLVELQTLSPADQAGH